MRPIVMLLANLMERVRCRLCNKLKPQSEFVCRLRDGRPRYERTCKTCQAEVSKKFRRDNPEKWKAAWTACSERLGAKGRALRFRQWVLRSQYGMELADYDTMLTKQGGGCAICKKPVERSGRSLGVDHDHVTNFVRGILCIDCNTGIGKFKDDPALLQQAITYLEQAKVLAAEVIKIGRGPFAQTQAHR